MANDPTDFIKAGVILVMGIVILSSLSTQIAKDLTLQFSGIGTLLIVVGILAIVLKFIKELGWI